jgi:hypothetical protein
MVVVIAVAAVAILAAVVVLALGKGGELAEVRPDLPPLRLPSGRPLVGTDVALLRLPKSLWGYNIGVTDDALSRMAHALTERDALVARLQQRLAEVQDQKKSVTGGVETGDSWFAAPAPYRSDPPPWTLPGSAPSAFGHTVELSGTAPDQEPPQEGTQDFGQDFGQGFGQGFARQNDQDPGREDRHQEGGQEGGQGFGPEGAQGFDRAGGQGFGRDFGPRPLQGRSYDARHEARGDTAPPEDR